MKISLISVITFLLLLASCSSTEEKVDAKTEAEQLYNDAKELVDDGHYTLATEYLNQIKSKHPYSYYATYAELMQADISYKQENYIEAAAQYVLFKEFHPKYKDMEFVFHRIADSYYQQKPETNDRDLSVLNDAVKYYSEYLLTFPKGKFSQEAKTRIEESRLALIDREFYVANFYFKTEKYASALFRFEEIFLNQKDQVVKFKGLMGAVKSAIKLKKFKKCISLLSKVHSEAPKYIKDEIKVIRSTCEKGI